MTREERRDLILVRLRMHGANDAGIEKMRRRMNSDPQIITNYEQAFADPEWVAGVRKFVTELINP